MTVKSLTPEQKGAIARLFAAGIHDINTLAALHKRSRRTIIRAIEEHSVDPGIKRRQKKPKPVILPVTIPTKTPWYRKVINSVNDFGRSIGLGT